MNKKVCIFLAVALMLFVTAFNGFDCYAMSYPEYEYLQVEDTCLYSRGTLPDYVIESEKEIWKRLPENIQEYLEQVGYTFYLIDEHYDCVNGNHHGQTVIFYNPKLDYSEGRARSDVNMNGMILIHEAGHKLQNEYYAVNGYDPNESSEWMYAYSTEYRSLSSLGCLSQYEVYNSFEAFAEAFAWYINEPKYLSENCPCMYRYMEDFAKHMDDWSSAQLQNERRKNADLG